MAAASSFHAVIAKDGLNHFVDVPARVTRAFAPFGEHGRVRVTGAINGIHSRRVVDGAWN